MKFINVLESIISFLINLPKDTTEAIQIYKKQLSLAKGNKGKISMAKNDLVYFFLNNWLYKILVPLTAITLIIVLIAKYYIPILAAVLVCYLVWSHFSDKQRTNENQQQQELATIYYEVSQFVFNPLRQLDTQLNIKLPQGVSDISIHPYYRVQNGVETLLFKLLKKSPEPIEIDKIAFNEKMLQSLVTSKLLEKQRLENLALFYNDIPFLVVDHFTDFGDYIQIQIVCVRSESSYNYVKQKEIVRQPTQTKTQPFDEDF